mmetsp:Transcript_77233/g.184945  ORF Transcript_77233/g.184945 Transcript_77233/m.184945 type:complete len:352 (+) Transcript_77233:1094-2149(+)
MVRDSACSDSRCIVARSSRASAMATSSASCTFFRSSSTVFTSLLAPLCASASAVSATVCSFCSAAAARSFAAAADCSASLARASASEACPTASCSFCLASSNFFVVSSMDFFTWVTSSFFFSSSEVSFFACTTRTSFTSAARCSAAAFHSSASRSAFCRAVRSFSASLTLMSSALLASCTSVPAFSADLRILSTSLCTRSFSFRSLSAAALYSLWLFSASWTTCCSFFTWPSASWTAFSRFSASRFACSAASADCFRSASISFLSAMTFLPNSWASGLRSASKFLALTSTKAVFTLASTSTRMAREANSKVFTVSLTCSWAGFTQTSRAVRQLPPMEPSKILVSLLSRSGT